MCTTLSLPSGTSRSQLIRTHIGLEIVADVDDYVSKLLLRDGIYEVPETDLISRIVRPGDTCIDAGCQIGYYSCLLAKLVGEQGQIYSFDANPNACINTSRNLRLNGFSFAEVIHAALADTEVELSFHISTDDQTGLSSLGCLPVSKETISVPGLRLETFISARRIKKIRLLKLDVEGAEEIVLRGLGPYLSSHMIDYILAECFDERLELLGTSTERVSKLLDSAGYAPWEYGTGIPAGWSPTTQISSRGDCNYLFASPSVSRDLPRVSLSAALQSMRLQRSQLETNLQQILQDCEALKQNADKQREELEKRQADIDWLLDSIKTHEQELLRLASQKRECERLFSQLVSSSGWRLLSRWHRMRDRLAPEDSWQRRLYDSAVRRVRRR